MKKRLVMFSFAMLLSDCTALTTALAPPYEPKPIHIYDTAQFAADVEECKLAGVNWQPHFSLGNVATATISGATSNSSLIPISPLVPAYGAAGGALRASADGLDVASGEHAAVFRNCLHDFVYRDGSAVVADPRN